MKILVATFAILLFGNVAHADWTTRAGMQDVWSRHCVVGYGLPWRHAIQASGDDAVKIGQVTCEAIAKYYDKTGAWKTIKDPKFEGCLDGVRYWTQEHHKSERDRVELTMSICGRYFTETDTHAAIRNYSPSSFDATFR